MVDGRIQKYYKEVCLLEQDFFKDPGKTIKQYQTEVTAKVGEKVAIRRFVRYEMGEGIEKRKDGMIHISKLSDKRVEKVEDVVNIGDRVKAEVIKVMKEGDKTKIDLKLLEILDK